MEDTFRHQGLRKKLVDGLIQKGITDDKVLQAISVVPRHLFMDSGFINFSYKDQAFPIAAGQTISQPYTVAFQSQLLQVEKGAKVLEIGTGSGYQTAVLLEMGARVYSIERQKVLHLQSQSLLHGLGYKPYLFYGDGYEGKASYGPFDRILVTAGAPDVPEKLLQQLKVGGRLVLPVGSGDKQEMLLVEKMSENDYQKTTHGNFLFVPLLKGVEGNG